MSCRLVCALDLSLARSLHRNLKAKARGLINDPAIKVIPACPPVQRLPKEEKKKAKVLSSPPPPPPLPPPPKLHMLVDTLPRPNQVNSVLSIGSTINANSNSNANSTPLDERPPPVSSNSSIYAPPPTAFSPPLTISSRSSVALDQTPPLVPKSSISSGPLIPTAAPFAPTASSSSSSPYPSMANGSSLPSSEPTVGSHCLQQLHSATPVFSVLSTVPSQASNTVLNDLNGYPAASQLSSFMHEIPARNTTSVASLLPPGAAEYHLNGSGDEEKTVKAVLTAPLAKAKRMRDSKNDIMDKSNKRPRAHPRAPAVLGSSSTSSSAGGTVGKSASMQRLINLVAPVVSETVTDFQRDRVAAAERRAAAAQSQPSTSTNGSMNTPNPPSEVFANSNSASHTSNLLSAGLLSMPGTSNGNI
uniref:Uncharacterized protein n=1 Tax=Caenorhabditis japonica TaxID=281687 RepID=A0A8R1DHM9_CAEJA